MHRSGVSIRQIVRQTGLNWATVHRYLREDKCPDWRTGRARPTTLDRWRDWIDQRLAEGNCNAADLYRQLRERGCPASAVTVRRFVTRRLAATGRCRERSNAAQAPRKVVSPKQLSYDLICHPIRRNSTQQSRLERIAAWNADSAEVVRLTDVFTAMVRRESKASSLATWMTEAESSCPELKGFVGGLRAEQASIENALAQPWSNGQVEGQVNRLKLIKRQMFGRASLSLLRSRVLPLGN